MSAGTNHLCAPPTQIKRAGDPVIAVWDEDRESEAVRRARIACVVDGRLNSGTIVVSVIHPRWRRSVVRHHIQCLAGVPAWEHRIVPRVQQRQRAGCPRRHRLGATFERRRQPRCRTVLPVCRSLASVGNMSPRCGEYVGRNSYGAAAGEQLKACIDAHRDRLHAAQIDVFERDIGTHGFNGSPIAGAVERDQTVLCVERVIASVRRVAQQHGAIPPGGGLVPRALDREPADDKRPFRDVDGDTRNPLPDQPEARNRRVGSKLILHDAVVAALHSQVRREAPRSRQPVESCMEIRSRDTDILDAGQLRAVHGDR